jgi:hypothetical protein
MCVRALRARASCAPVISNVRRHMTPQQLLGIGIRLFALWLAVTSVGYFGSIPGALSKMPTGTGSAVALAYGLGGAYLLCAIVLWFFPMFIAHRLLPKTSHENYLKVPAFDLARVGCGLIGLWLMAKALPIIVWLLFRSFLIVEAGSTFSSLPPESKVDVSVAFFGVLFALLLMVKSSVFARAVLALPAPNEADRDDV